MFLARFNFKTNLRLVGWLPVAGSALAIALMLVLDATLWRVSPLLATTRAVETFLPLMVGLQAAFLLSPEDEPPLELLLTCRRPLARPLLERLALLAALQGGVGVIGSLVVRWLGGDAQPEPFLLATARWVAPSVFIAGAALAVTLLTRKGTLSALMVLLLWGSMLLGSDAAVRRIFFLWPVHLFMQPQGVTLAEYARNRAALILLGLCLTALAAHVAGDEERMLGVRQPESSRWSYWLKLSLTGLAAGLLMFYAGYCALWVDAEARPVHRAVCCVTPADAGFDYEEVSFTAPDGVTLAGWYIPSRNGAAVILLHGSGSSRVWMIWQAVMLARNGYGVLMYDLRGHGESGGDMRTLGWLDVNDVAAALDLLQRRDDVDPQRIGIMGFSVGGQIAIRAAAQMNTIRAVAADGPSLASYRDVPPPDSFLDRVVSLDNWILIKFFERRTGVPVPPGITDVIADIAPRPILLIATGPDGDMERRIARHYYDLAGEPKTLWTIPETSHGGGVAAWPEEYKERMVSFFDQALLEDEGAR